MISEKDVDVFIKAKMDQRLRNSLSILMLVSSLILLSINAFFVQSDYLVVSGCVFMGFFALYNADYFLVPTVKRKTLLNIIEKQINEDSMALKYLSKLKQNKGL